MLYCISRGALMYIELKWIKFKNIMSYGNNISEFRFDNGLNLISAKNGSGKTTILEALAFNWYGKPYRDVKIGDLVNRKNKKNLYTESEFEIDGKIYNIVRTLAPAKLIIKIDGEVQDNLSAKRLDQEEINKILGVDFNIFKLIIALSVNYNKPFLSMTAAAKRDTIESIFNIKVFGEMLSKLKKKTTALKSDKAISDGSLKTLENSIIALRKQKSEIEVSQGKIDAQNQNEIAELKQKIENCNKELEKLENSTSIFREQKRGFVIPNFDNEISSNRTKIITTDAKIKELNKQRTFFDTHDDCPTCGILMTPEHKDKEVKALDKELFKLNTKLTKYQTEKTELLKMTAIVEAKERELKNINETISSNIERARSVYNDREWMKEKIKSLTETKLTIDTKALTDEYEKQIEEYRKHSKVSSELQESLIVNDYVSKILSEDGIKSFFFKRLVPVLNKKINEYLTSFELPVIITFNEYMEETINIQVSNEKDISYMSFSEGEKKRIDIAILLSFIETTKILSNWNCNVIMFDEVLDNATDADGLEKLLASIKRMTKENNRLCAYIISHRESNSELYDKVISIKKSAGFSKL